MANYVISPVQIDSTSKEQDGRSAQYKLLWRQGQLLVRKHLGKQHDLPALPHEEWLVDCLKNSPVQLVRLDARLGEVELNRWVNACKQAGKSAYLWVPSNQKQFWKKKYFEIRLQQFVSWILALLLAIVLSPAILGLVLLICLNSTGLILDLEWYVGKRGKLFQAFKFCTPSVDDEGRLPFLRHWMRQWKLERLPQLLNVLRGEMSLIDASHLSLSETLELVSSID